jgi:hypothetical protein
MWEQSELKASLKSQPTDLGLTGDFILFERNLDLTRLPRQRSRDIADEARAAAHLHVFSVQPQHLVVVPADNLRNAPPLLLACCCRGRMQSKRLGETRGRALTAAASCSFVARKRPSTARRSSSQIRSDAPRPRARTCISRCRHTASLRNSVS